MADDDTDRRRDDDVTLDDLREEIAAIDRELVDLIARRTYVAEAVAEVKADRGLETTDASQEERVLERAAADAAAFDLDPGLVKSVFRLLIELNKVEQRSRR